MMRIIVVVFLVAIYGTLSAEDREQIPHGVGITIDRGLDFLVKDALKWKNDHQCVSCHHAAMVVWAMQEAKQRKRTVDESILADLTTWISESGEGKSSVPRPPERPRALNTKALYFALALTANPVRESGVQSGLNRMLTTMKEDQLDDGSWSAWPETRPPFFGSSDDSMTALATLAVAKAESSDTLIQDVRAKGIQWLSNTKSDDDPQSVAIRLVLWRRIGRSVEELNPLVQQIKQRQNADGGWSQSPEMSSDAWATGQAVYALAHAGITATEPVMERAHTFLIKTQREDGSWPMTSRPTKPGGPGSNSLIPIIGGGSAWAVLGLARSS